MKYTKQIVGIGLLTLVGSGYAFAQTSENVSATSNTQFKMGQMMKTKQEGGMFRGKGMGMHKNKQAIHESILAGNYATFQNLASTTPIGKIDQKTFNDISAQMKIVKAAKGQIQTILKSAGVSIPGATPM